MAEDGPIPKYPKCRYPSGKYHQNLLDGEIVIHEKIDGCFHAKTKVNLVDGSKERIKDIYERVENGEEVEVLSYDSVKGEVVANKVTSAFCYPMDDEWQVLQLKRVGNPRLICTKDHEIHTPEGWVEAGDLSPGNRVHVEGQHLSYEQEQFIMGTLMGDAHISIDGHFPRLNVGHVEDQMELVDLCAKILGPLGIREDERISGYGSLILRIHTDSRGELLPFVDLCLDNKNNRAPNKEWVSSMDPIALAVWYMDDGSLNIGTNDQRPRANLHTQSFTEEECKVILETLEEVWSLSGTVNDYGKGPLITIDADSSEAFFSMVSPYILDSMDYKLPKKYRDVPCFWEHYSVPQNRGVGLIEISDAWTGVAEWRSNKDYMYDLEVENTHCYFVENVLVHNSQGASMVKGDNLYFRSKNTHRDMFSSDKLFAPTIGHFKDVASRMEPGLVYYGEVMATESHNTLTYDAIPDGHFVLFDIWDTEVEDWLPEAEVQSWASELEVEHPATLHYGPFDGDLDDLVDHCEEEFIGSESILGGPDIEGVVVKNRGQPGIYSRMTVAKIVDDSFKEQHQKSWDNKEDDKGSVVENIIEEQDKENRWEKVIQHAKEDGLLDGEMADLAHLIPAFKDDLYSEISEDAKERLWDAVKGDIFRALKGGFPEYYKEKLKDGDI